MYKKTFNRELIIIPIICIVTIVLACFTGNYRFFTQCFLREGQDIFMDFLNSIRDASGFDVYSEYTVIYAPLVNLFFMFCSFFFPRWNLDHDHDRYAMLRQPASYIIYVLYLILVFVLVFFAMKKLLKKRKTKEFVFIYILIVCSFPFLYAAERGNTLLFTFAMMLYFFAMKDSEKPFEREMAIICFAVATVVKLYPVIFVLFLFKNKKWKDITKYGIYTSVLLFLPFVFYGGLEGLYIMIHTSLNLFGASLQHFTNAYLLLMYGFGVSSTIAKIVNYFFIVCLFVSFFVAKKKYQEYMALALVLTCLSFGTEPYTTIFFLIGLLLLIDEDEIGRIELVYLAILIIYLTFNSLSWFLSMMAAVYIAVLYVLQLVCLPIATFKKQKNIDPPIEQ